MIKKMNILVTEEQLKRIVSKSCDIFNDSTGSKDYDSVLYNESNRYLSSVVGKIVLMSPDEYLDRCAHIQGTSFSDQIDLIDDVSVEKIIKVINGGGKLSLPYIDYSSNKRSGLKSYTQEGRHRVMAAKRIGCDRVKVALFFNVGEDDSYSESVMSIEDMLGKWEDIKVDKDGKYYLEYDIYSDSTMFLDLFPEFDEKYLLYEKVMYSKKFDYDFEYNRDPEFYNLSEQMPEYNKFLLKKLRVGLSDEKLKELFNFDEKDINDLFNGRFPNYSYIISFFKYVDDDYIYRYNKEMLNYIAGYQFYIHNSDYFESIDNDKFSVDIDNENKKIRLYCNMSIENGIKYKSGKSFLLSNNIKITENLPIYNWEKGGSKIEIRYIKEYLKKKKLV